MSSGDVLIDYPKEYADAQIAIFEFVKKGNFSSRFLILELTDLLLSYNDGHYTAFYARRQCLRTGEHLLEELEWIREYAYEHPKSYQVWHHRQYLVDRLADENVAREELHQISKFTVPESDEVDGIDPKNYHAWSYRRWLLKKFSLPEDKVWLQSLIKMDPHNNSVWNHARSCGFTELKSDSCVFNESLTAFLLS